MLPFISLVYISVLMFTIIDRVLFFGNNIEGSLTTVQRFGKIYSVLFGENPNAKDMTNLEWAIFFIFTCSMNIIAFNLLISLVSNTFDKVMTILPAIQSKAKAEILVEIGSYSAAIST